MDIEAFRKNFPEFTDTTRFPEPMLLFWSGLAEKQVLEPVWDTFYSEGVQLLTAHYAVIASKNAEAGELNGSVGSITGPVSSKTVGSVSVSYINESALEANAGTFNTTSYGRQFANLYRMVGAGAYFV